MAIGNGRPYNVALVTLDPDFAPAFAQQQGIESGQLEALAAEPAVVAAIGEAVEAGNAKLARVEQIKRFEIVPGDWPPGGQET